ncbi:putative lipid-binding transport protein (Tim44 family) [Rhodobium orientis]|uniref:Calcium-binding protein n=1 Tax=Rhodobium orientis TaxID=34017 RepID=A0A327K0A9_9HYPH|nr:Tim44/TimA family putative adaptor protein [Rhodobium orientis]MBB4304295.1 putative lipid-binding transport protein (Tim44 family) [Rhodobium orientis]MBK5948211.1 calcium-binding protein [Rhodobium orientis]RAI28798.1 calcium-binding protein [Rhodobium orientis]
MTEFLDVYNIFFLILAVAIFLRLRSVLGRRTGHERPPFDPYSSRGEQEKPSRSGGDNVVTLPRHRDEAPATGIETDERIENVDRMAPEGSALNNALRTIVSADRSFDAKHFLTGARSAYEMIVTAFADGDRRSLQNLLANDVYDSFVGAIADRESRGETIESTFIGIDKAEIVEAGLQGATAQITVRFKSQLISVTKDSEGRIVEGDPNAVNEVTDIWTFARDTESPDPNWKLVATESGD